MFIWQRGNNAVKAEAISKSEEQLFAVPDLRLEAHVEHAVRLVEDDVGDLVE